MYVAVVGPGDASPEEAAAAREAGRLLTAAGHIVLTGGLGGVMAAAAEGASGGTVVALLPGSDRAAASPGHTVVLPTGLGELRNGLLVRSADAVLAIGGAWGTLSEIALAVRTEVPVYAVRSWDLPSPVHQFDDVAEAVASLTRDVG